MTDIATAAGGTRIPVAQQDFEKPAKLQAIDTTAAACSHTVQDDAMLIARRLPATT